MGPLPSSDLHLLFVSIKQYFKSLKHTIGNEGHLVHLRFMKCNVINKIITKGKRLRFLFFSF